MTIGKIKIEIKWQNLKTLKSTEIKLQLYTLFKIYIQL
jgi:hypothetical protein